MTPTTPPPNTPPGASLIARLQARYGSELDAALSISLSADFGASDDAGHGVAPAESLSPQALTRYRVGNEIARGGMGAILEAWDLDLDRALAMKVLLERSQVGGEGADSARELELVRRFVREARITGQLDHPGIVPVHELGVDDDGRVFFTMRRLRGVDLQQVFARARDGSDGWSLARALEVLLKICDTVAYAHARGVVHRDLKPANVMVGEFGAVYVLDWGLAKVLGGGDDASDATNPAFAPIASTDADQTIAGAVLGTPAYMSPEQASGAGGDRRIDVYALGALIYTLYAGRSPYLDGEKQRSSREVLAAVRDGPPTPLRSLAPQIPEPLAVICEHAMARAAEDRFASAGEVAAAIRQHLEAERVAAESARRLRGELENSDGVRQFLCGLFRVEQAGDAAKPVTMSELLERGAANIEKDLADQEPLKAAVHSSLAEVYYAIGANVRAVEHAERAVEFAREHLGDGVTAAQLGERLGLLATAVHETGDYQRSERLFDEAIPLLRGGREKSRVLSRYLSAYGTHLLNSGRLGPAREIIEEGLALRRADGNFDKIAESLTQKGVVLDDLGDFRGGEAAYREALEIRERLYGPRHSLVATIVNNLGALSCYRGDFAAAESQYRRALEIRRETLGAEHLKTALAMMNVGYTLGKLGRYAEAEVVLRETIALRERLVDPQHPLTAHTQTMLAEVLVHSRKIAEAEEVATRAAAAADKRASADHPLHSLVAYAFALVRESQGQPVEAERLINQAIAHDLRAGAPLTAHTVDHRYKLAKFYLRQNRRAEALPHLECCLEIYQSAFGAEAPIARECEELLEG
ncbi:MAG: tetratricopeptide repeat protein [Planctomycetota bacterium]